MDQATMRRSAELMTAFGSDAHSRAVDECLKSASGLLQRYRTVEEGIENSLRGCSEREKELEGILSGTAEAELQEKINDMELEKETRETIKAKLKAMENREKLVEEMKAKAASLRSELDMYLVVSSIFWKEGVQLKGDIAGKFVGKKAHIIPFSFEVDKTHFEVADELWSMMDEYDGQA
ncbi:unnamed protein product [Ostreobium quekettii]|uniref:Kinetochore protein Spc24 n=1 Tax=Ostreobium quekettii TaxID=121088 RepID=A0A8S1J5H4_9CHLO|nr:unnamed protein product [Ostreobium quekettii]